MPDLSTVNSEHDVATVVARAQDALRRRGVELFAAIDHAAGARGAGLELADEVVLVFGNPAVGTALMQADPRVGLDLPLRLLVWDEAGTTHVGWHDPHTLAGEYELTGHDATLDAMSGLLASVAADAAG